MAGRSWHTLLASAFHTTFERLNLAVATAGMVNASSHSNVAAHHDTVAGICDVYAHAHMHTGGYVSVTLNDGVCLPKIMRLPA